MTERIMADDHALNAIQFSLSVMEFNADTLDHLVMLLGQAGRPLITVPKGHRIRIEEDLDYEPYGDYDLDEERRNLANGEWGVYCVDFEKQCDCGNWVLVTSLSGVVVEGDYWQGEHTELNTINESYLRHVAAELITEGAE